MSCGKPHETPCSEVLAELYSYLDKELDPRDRAKVAQHLDECGPCLREHNLEELVKKLVHRHCGCDPAPEELRAKVLARIQQVRIELEVTEVRAE